MLDKTLNPLSLDSPVTAIPMIGEVQAGKLERLGINKIKDLLYHFPIRYTDTRNILTIRELFHESDGGTVRATVDQIKNNYTRSRKVITKAVVSDGTGKLTIIWFNQSFITRVIKPGERFLFQLKLPKNSFAKNFYCTSYEKDSGERSHLGRLTPHYSQTAGISSKWFRARLNFLKPRLDNMIEDPLNDKIREREGLIKLGDALRLVHFPEKETDIDIARKRLGFDEMLDIATKLEKRKESFKKRKARKIDISERAIKKLISSLKFNLTSDQEKALNEILNDLQAERPMNRLLNGDVGSGKTIVSVISSFSAILSGYSVAVMAPTTILANQHYQSFNDLLEPLNIKTQLLTSQTVLKQPDSDPQVIIGTHALLYEKKLPDNIALYIVDEQHRFGVVQREKLKKTQAGFSPHYLTMTATPIPRTLTNVVYGDMDVSVIKEMPKDRVPIKTKLLSQDKRAACLEWIRLQLVEHPNENQAYIVLPLVDETEKNDLKAATQVYRELSEGIFKDLRVGLLHGRLKEREKDSVTKQFRNRELDVLVSTTVIEVGIDVSSASIMVIEHAERFGLAQLHQLRGRIGRGEKQSYCFVIPSAESEQNQQVYDRLQFFSENSSGFKVAEYDLSQRGPGEVYGTVQSGILSMKIADITDIALLKKARLLVRELNLHK